jgi:hypothetical protein
LLTLELDSNEARALAEVLAEYVSDLRMEIADTDSMAVREELKARENLLQGLIRRLGGGQGE